MVKHATFDAEENQKKIDSSGVSKSTEYAKKFVNSNFDKFVAEKLGSASISKILEDNSVLEELLIEYFDTYRLNNGDLPSGSSLESTKSHIKMRLLKDSNGKIDISNQNVFPRFHRLWKGQLKLLKKNGRLDKNHNQPIPDAIMLKLNELLVVLTNLLQMKEGDPNFQANLNMLPSTWQNNYHRLANYGAIFVVVLHVSP